MVRSWMSSAARQTGERRMHQATVAASYLSAWDRHLTDQFLQCSGMGLRGAFNGVNVERQCASPVAT